jgi:hypothetical protein
MPFSPVSPDPFRMLRGAIVRACRFGTLALARCGELLCSFKQAGKLHL